MLTNGAIHITRWIVNSGNTRNDYPLTNIAYSKNGGAWITVAYEESVSVSSGDKIRWKSNGTRSGNTYTTTNGETGSLGINSKFVSSANYNVYGNPKSLLYRDNFRTFDETNITVDFGYLFNNTDEDLTTGVVSAKNLVMPSNIGDGACVGMFQNCKNLTTAPSILPATTLTRHCYNSMFQDCASLVNAPILPATTLEYCCYREMFENCTSLITAPDLPATTLAGSTECYVHMFLGCSSLNYIKAMFTTDPTNTTYTVNWVGGVAANGTFVKNTAASWNVVGTKGVPVGWTILRASE